MSKQQVLIIEPQHELKFKVDSSGIFQQGCTTYMRLLNPTSDTVLFKIKTTAPKKYCVRPNSGTLEPNGKVAIAITPQPVYVDPNEEHKHKFMVQSVIAPEGKTNVDQVWKEISPQQLMDSKLKCVFETSRGGAGYSDTADNARQNETNKKKGAEDAKSSNPLKELTDNAGPNEITKKRVEVDENKVSALLKGNSLKSDNEDGAQLQKAVHEVRQLREEESKLRQENLQLKEEVLRLRQAAGGDGRSIGAGTRHSFAPPEKNNLMMMPMIAVAIGILGIIIGKFFM